MAYISIQGSQGSQGSQGREGTWVAMVFILFTLPYKISVGGGQQVIDKLTTNWQTLDPSAYKRRVAMLGNHLRPLPTQVNFHSPYGFHCLWLV